ncbi:ATP-binding protein, partial [Rhodopseudomonas sp. BR0G17]|uniref:ATP-binding protein n=1 Tax=Rhodopseudomonas sp. BR0G17 TaxID=2269368 RepID=UPI0019688461
TTPSATTNQDNPSADEFSQSTTSMIVAALSRELHRTAETASSGFPWRDYGKLEIPPLDRALEERIGKAIDMLVARWDSNTPHSKLNSKTYGHNDILSLSWHYDVFKFSIRNSSKDQEIADSCKRLFQSRAQLFVNPSEKRHAICNIFREQSTQDPNNSTIGNSSYILLRFIRCLRAIDTPNDPAIINSIASAAKRFRSRIHDHLSLAEIVDSRFDAAELAFCLEGLLHLSSEQVDPLLFERTITVLAKAQEQNTYWRSETPLLVRRMGHVLFPIGVEAARSILNSIAIFVRSGSARGSRRTIQPQYTSLLKRYWAWLKTRQTAIKLNGKLVYGWHSEYVSDARLIDTWESSQILEFLLGLRTILAADAAHQLLTRSRLAVRYPKPPNTDWNNIIKSNEPCGRTPYDVYRQIGEDFIESRKAKAAPEAHNWSMLLYGPPGTGKTTIADSLGDFLNLPVITVTVSDFLGEGESRMESRVKNIFTVIERQPSAIVLFDEMDQFLLDRNSKLFRQQDSVFQFLTPGMLIKFANLRKSRSVIFIIATNYEERIDPAIKRTGRIDRRYLLLPPDTNRRLAILRECEAHRKLIDGADQRTREHISEASCLLTYSDLKHVTAKPHAGVDKLIEDLKKADRTVKFSTLSSRLKCRSNGLEEEIKGLMQLIDEAQVKPMAKEGEWFGSREFIEFANELKKDHEHLWNYYDTLNNEKDNRRYTNDDTRIEFQAKILT